MWFAVLERVRVPLNDSFDVLPAHWPAPALFKPYAGFWQAVITFLPAGELSLIVIAL